MAYITCDNLILGYEGTPVAENISFTVEKGNYLCIVGENGAGKSTLMKTLLGLTPLMGGSITYGDAWRHMKSAICRSRHLCRRTFRHPCGKSYCLERSPSAAGDPFLAGNRNSLPRSI